MTRKRKSPSKRPGKATNRPRLRKSAPATTLEEGPGIRDGGGIKGKSTKLAGLLGKAAAHHRAGRLDEAIATYRKAMKAAPASLQVMVNLANALNANENAEEAVEAYQAALAIAPASVEARNGLGVALKKLGRLDEAAGHYRAALAAAPKAPYLHNNLGNVLREREAWSEAADHYHRALELEPDYAEAHFSLGLVFKAQGNFSQAIEHLERAIALSPTNADAHFSLAMAYLMVGNYVRGWQEYEWRWKCDHFPGRDIPGPVWNGSPLRGRSILLHAEQGFGDTLQFLRYASLVKRHGAARVIFYCQPALARIAATIEGIDEVIVEGSPIPPFDVYTALMSLPAIFRTTLDTVPAKVPYLSAPAEPHHSFDAHLEKAADKIRIGIAWAGRPEHPNDHRRSCRSQDLLALADRSDAALFSLQKEHRGDEPKLDPRIVDLGPLLDDFGDTAAVVARLDLVISVDSALAHLAGAMGRPVWLLLPHLAEWRWLRGRDDSPWYPTMRLFRQRHPGDWREVIQRVSHALDEWRPADLAAKSLGNILLVQSAFREVTGQSRFTMPFPRDRLHDAGIAYLVRDEQEAGGYEYATRCFLDSHLTPGDLFIDVGAHWGIHSLGAATRHPGQIAVLAIEPDLDNAEMLRCWIAHNGVEPQVELVVAAAGEKEGRGLLRKNTTMGHRVDPADNSTLDTSSDELIVPITTIDQILEDRPQLRERPIVLKIDVEGAEPQVLKGARNSLAGGRVKAIVFERGTAHRDGEMRGRMLAAMEDLQGQGYALYRFADERQAGSLLPVDPNGPPENIFVLANGEAPKPDYGAGGEMAPLSGNERTRRKHSVEREETDFERWRDPARLDPAWDRRAQAAADFVPAGATVLDLGCGAMALERLLPPGCTYLPCDLVARDERTSVRDFNAGELPDPAEATHVVVLGVLEYIYDPAAFLRRIGGWRRPLVISYCPTDYTEHDKFDRPALGWVNHLSRSELLGLANQAGFALKAERRIDRFNLVWRLEPDSSPTTTSSRVLVVSYSNVGNFGDRLGHHLLSSVLPPGATVRHAHFKPWDVPDETYDLVIVGIGNSIFGPLLDDNLFELVERAPKSIGIFGTQYRESLDRPKFMRLLDGLDLWFARYEEDALLYGRGRDNVQPLGDWLIDAFPLTNWRLSRRLVVDDEVLRDLPLDRTIQRIQSYREVWSSRLHPLLCALTSAERCAYREQREMGGEAPSGKFRSLFLDVFGHDKPEARWFEVDRDAVTSYKAKVRENIGALRATIAQLLDAHSAQ